MLSLKSERIPRATIRRLAVYVQVLESMQRNGVEVISSGPLAEACDVNASQVRKPRSTTIILYSLLLIL